jgi:hypothetical protein
LPVGDELTPVMTPVDQIRPHPENPRKGARPLIRESILQNGFYGALVCQRSTGFILVGNHRYVEAVDLGATELPVLWRDCDDATARRILLADNRTSDLAEYDDAALAAILREASDAGLEGSGYTDADFDAILREATEVLRESEAAPEGAGERGSGSGWEQEEGEEEEIPEQFLVLVEIAKPKDRMLLMSRLLKEGHDVRLWKA